MSAEIEVFNIDEVIADQSKLSNVKAYFEKYGYIVVHLAKRNQIFESIKTRLESDLAEGGLKLNPKFFHYNESPRVIEFWKKCEAVKQLAKDPEVLTLLRLLYGLTPVPFSTINFRQSTEQPLHSDYIHFASMPDGHLAAVWVALEDIGIDQGPLQVVPQSQTMPYLTNKIIGLTLPKSAEQIKLNYTLYEQYLERKIREAGMPTIPVTMKKGDALVWSANLAHGGAAQKDKTLTRFSQVTHYHFRESEFIYNPLFSSPEDGYFAFRNLNEMEIL